MGYERTGPGNFEVRYATVEDMDPKVQAALLQNLEHDLATAPASVLFVVETMSVPRAVPEFWLTVTKRHAPRLCAMAIVSDHLAVRTAASGFSVANRIRNVKLEVKSFHKNELEAARSWCRAARLKPA